MLKISAGWIALVLPILYSLSLIVLHRTLVIKYQSLIFTFSIFFKVELETVYSPWKINKYFVKTNFESLLLLSVSFMYRTWTWSRSILKLVKLLCHFFFCSTLELNQQGLILTFLVKITSFQIFDVIGKKSEVWRHYRFVTALFRQKWKSLLRKSPLYKWQFSSLIQWIALTNR